MVTSCRQPLWWLTRLLLLPFLLLAGGCGAPVNHQPPSTLAESCLDRPWPHEHSDLQPDPALHFGRLANGLKYVIMVNHEPRHRVGLYLDVQAGSLNERSDQRGIAHFLEHMAFNGSRHYPPGSLIDFFQNAGMEFGADSNAHTGYDETVYNLFLPSTDNGLLDQGLQVLADYGGGLLLLPEEVDRERGVILAEKRSRDTAESRVAKARIRFASTPTLVARRDPIGTESVLKKADAALIRSFYDTWYRPDNMIVVVVGEVDPEAVARRIRHYFAGLRKRDGVVPCPRLGKLPEEPSPDYLAIREPDLGYGEVSLESVWNEELQPDTRSREVQRLREYLAMAMLKNRLQTLVNQQAGPLTSVETYKGVFVRHFGYATIQAKTLPDRWQEGLTLLTTTLRQALRFGFTAGELVRGRRQFMAQLEKEVATASSRDSRDLAGQIITNLNNGDVMLSPRQELDLFGPLLQKMTLEEINTTLRQLWKHRRLVEVASSASLADDPDQARNQVRLVYARAQARAISPWTPRPLATFPYLPLPEQQGRVVSHTRLAAIGVDRYILSGGVTLNIKQTDFQPNGCQLMINLGHGRLEEPTPGLGMLAEGVVNDSGFGKMTVDQIRRALAGTTADLSFKVGEESFSLVGKGLSRELELLFQLSFTWLEDPAFRASALRRTRKRYRQMYEQLASAVEGVATLQADRFFAGGNRRYGMVPLARFMALSLDQVRQWLLPVLHTARLEINVVGDVDPATVLALSRQYFCGRNRVRRAVPRPGPVTFPTGQVRTVQVNTVSPKGLVLVGWKTDDFWDISQTRRLSVLAALLQDRLLRRIREQEGVTYSPAVYNIPSRVDPGYGVLRARVIVPPAQAGKLALEIRRCAAEIGSHGVRQAELNRILRPVLTSIRDLQQKNDYWIRSVLSLSSRHPEQLRWPLTIKKDFSAITGAELTGLARRYLRPGQAATMILVPRRIGTPAAPARKPR